jgi:hypothetical protein
LKIDSSIMDLCADDILLFGGDLNNFITDEYASVILASKHIENDFCSAFSSFNDEPTFQWQDRYLYSDEEAPASPIYWNGPFWDTDCQYAFNDTIKENQIAECTTTQTITPLDTMRASSLSVIRSIEPAVASDEPLDTLISSILEAHTLQTPTPEPAMTTIEPVEIENMIVSGESASKIKPISTPRGWYSRGKNSQQDATHRSQCVIHSRVHKREIGPVDHTMRHTEWGFELRRSPRAKRHRLSPDNVLYLTDSPYDSRRHPMDTKFRCGRS